MKNSGESKFSSFWSKLYQFFRQINFDWCLKVAKKLGNPGLLSDHFNLF